MNDVAAALPVISVVVVGRAGFESLRPLLACLADQTIAGRMEVVAVLPTLEGDPPPDCVAAFAALRRIAAGPIGNRGAAAAHGVRAATAPIVAFSENHCFPEAGWAEALVAAHDGAVVGVAPAILNANPESVLSWTSYTGGYVMFAEHKPAGEVAEMPLHNASYRREALLPLANELDDLLADERRLMRRLQAGGARFRFHPEARARHVNEATWRLVLGLSYFNGRRYGGRRGEAWSWPKRMGYAMAFPLLSLPLLRESARQVAPLAGRPSLASPAFVGALWLQALAHALGEAVGYLNGPKDVFDFVDDEEFMILERLGGRSPRDPQLAGYLTVASAVDVTRAAAGRSPPH